MTVSAAMRIIFVGDILLHSNYDKIAIEQGPSFVFEKISTVLKDADLRFGNLETVLSKKGTPLDGKGCLIGDENYIGALRSAGFDILSLANNHTFDFGSEAFEDMAYNLQNNGICIVGAGGNLQESRKMLSRDLGNIRLGFLAYSSRTNNGRNYATSSEPGVAPLEEEVIIDEIKRNKRDIDCLIVSLHWGIEHSPYPTPDQVALAHEIIDVGAKIVIGNHPQILQAVERYHDGLIMYSLGNLCHSDYYWKGLDKIFQFKLKSVDRESVMIRVSLSKYAIEDVQVFPLRINDSCQPELCEGEISDAILLKLRERTAMVTKSDFDKYWDAMIIKKRIEAPIKIWWRNGSLLDKIRNFKFSQLQTIIDLFMMFVGTKFTSTPAKWQLFNPRNDKKPRPFCGTEEDK